MAPLRGSITHFKFSIGDDDRDDDRDYDYDRDYDRDYNRPHNQINGVSNFTPESSMEDYYREYPFSPLGVRRDLRGRPIDYRGRPLDRPLDRAPPRPAAAAPLMICAPPSNAGHSIIGSSRSRAHSVAHAPSAAGSSKSRATSKIEDWQKGLEARGGRSVSVAGSSRDKSQAPSGARSHRSTSQAPSGARSHRSTSQALPQGSGAGSHRSTSQVHGSQASTVRPSASAAGSHRSISQGQGSMAGRNSSSIAQLHKSVTEVEAGSRGGSAAGSRQGGGKAPYKPSRLGM
ncbi:hypothetical protein EDC01DRAFT_754567 [Geopyxis carbonaria]|nr:hypothetical protein EDC01DRAFT_754567 [Geopyxis carbonaria]